MPQRTLSRLGLALLLAALLASTPACIKQKDVTKLKKDGTGTATLTLELDLTNEEEIKATAAALGLAGGIGDIAEMFDPEAIKAGAEGVEGLKVVSATRDVSEDGKQVKVVLEVEFKDLQVLAKSGAFRVPEIDVSIVTMALAKLEDGNYVLQRRVLGDVLPATGGDPEAQAMIEVTLGMFESFLSTMQLTSVLELPTRIVETNGVQGTGNTVTWKTGFKDLSDAAKRTQTVVFAGEGLEWKSFGKVYLPAKEDGAEEEGAKDGDAEKEGTEKEGTEKPPEDDSETPGK